MRDRRYLFVILDGRGRRLRRVAVARRTIVAAIVLFSVMIVVTAGLAAHGILERQLALQAREVAQENQELRELQATIAAQLPEARETASRAQLTFNQLWAKSGLGREARVLGVGPLDTTDPAGPAGTTAFTSETHLRSIELLDIPLELDRLSNESPKLHSSLGEILEYFHDAERLLRNTPSINPTHSVWLTSGFGRRSDPITGAPLMHKGIDLGGRTGDPVFAPADGVVIFVGRRGGYGITVVLDHGFGVQTHFAHLNRYRVRVNEQVERGQLIADVGTTGKSTGPHLHYEVRKMGQPLDPVHFIMN